MLDNEIEKFDSIFKRYQTSVHLHMANKSQIYFFIHCEISLNLSEKQNNDFYPYHQSILIESREQNGKPKLKQ